MINLFIDAQIWLSIYSFSKNDLKQFSKLKQYINDGGVKIILTEQVKDEVFRNRENKLHDVIDKTKNINFSIPVLYQGYNEDYVNISRKLNDLQKMNNELQSKIENDIFEQKLPQDILINDLFSLSTVLKTTDEIINKAIYRFRILGNPPGKDNKCGDAISWETLLSKYNSGDLFFISDDKDYKSLLDKDRFNQYLINEWEEKKKSKIYFYNGLNEFFNNHLSDIKLTARKEQNELIKELDNSLSFERTHSVIAKMSKYTDWDEKQTSMICNISHYNTQVFNIIEDSDVFDFLKQIIMPFLFTTEDNDIIFMQQYIYEIETRRKSKN